MKTYLWIALLALCMAFSVGNAAFASDLVDADGNVVLKDVSADSIPRLVQLLGDDRPTVRLQAEEFLVSYGEDSLGELHGSLERGEIVREILIVLRRIPKPSSVGPVVKYLLDSDPELSNTARGTLMTLGDDAVPEVAELLGEERVGEAARGILVGVRSPSDESYSLLRTKLTADNPKPVRTGAAEILGAWRDEYIVDYIESLVGDPDAGFRAAVLGAYDKTVQDVDREIPLGLIGDDSPDVRRIAAGLLGRAGDEEDSSVLAGLASGDPDGMVRAVALNSLAGMHGTGAEEALMRGLNDPDPDVVAAALWYISDYQMVEAVPVIEDMFRSGAPVTEEKQVFDEALLRLAELGEKVDLEPFLKYIGPEQEGDTRKLALEMIAAAGTSGDEAAIDAVTDMLAEERDSSIRKLGEDALEALKE